MSGYVRQLPARIRSADAAKEIGVSMNVLYRLAQDEQIECYRIANRYEFTREGIEKFLESVRQPQIAA